METNDEEHARDQPGCFDHFILPDRGVHIEDDAIQAAPKDGGIHYGAPTADEAILMKSSNAVPNRLLIDADFLRDRTKRRPQMGAHRIRARTLDQGPENTDISGV